MASVNAYTTNRTMTTSLSRLRSSFTPSQKMFSSFSIWLLFLLPQAENADGQEHRNAARHVDDVLDHQSRSEALRVSAEARVHVVRGWPDRADERGVARQRRDGLQEPRELNRRHDGEDRRHEDGRDLALRERRS